MLITFDHSTPAISGAWKGKAVRVIGVLALPSVSGDRRYRTLSYSSDFSLNLS